VTGACYCIDARGASFVLKFNSCCISCSECCIDIVSVPDGKKKQEFTKLQQWKIRNGWKGAYTLFLDNEIYFTVQYLWEFFVKEVI
jgi:hypothetical protein